MIGLAFYRHIGYFSMGYAKKENLMFLVGLLEIPLMGRRKSKYLFFLNSKSHFSAKSKYLLK